MEHLKDKSAINDFVKVSIFLLFAKSIAAAKEIFIASEYGVSHVTDAFNVAFNFINWPLSLWMNVATIVLIPLHYRLNKTEGREFRNAIFTWTCILACAISIVLSLFVPMYIDTLSNIELAQKNLINSSINWLITLIPFGAVTTLFSVWMIAERSHRSTIFEAIPPLGLICAIMALPGSGLMSLVYGIGFGFFAHLLIAYKFLNPHLRPTNLAIRINKNYLKGIFKISAVTLIGQLVMNTTVLYDQHYSLQIGEYAVSLLSYANKVVMLFMGLISIAVTRAALPTFSEIVTTDRTRLEKYVFSWLIGSFFIGFVGTLCIIYFSSEIISMLYQRGSFTKADTEAVSYLFNISILQLPLYFSGSILVSALISTEKYIQIALISILAVIIKILYIEIKVYTIKLQLADIMISNVVLYLVSVLMCLMSIVYSSRASREQRSE